MKALCRCRYSAATRFKRSMTHGFPHCALVILACSGALVKSDGIVEGSVVCSGIRTCGF
jgi:hypothetical protein